MGPPSTHLLLLQRIRPFLAQGGMFFSSSHSSREENANGRGTFIYFYLHLFTCRINSKFPFAESSGAPGADIIWLEREWKRTQKAGIQWSGLLVWFLFRHWGNCSACSPTPAQPSIIKSWTEQGCCTQLHHMGGVVAFRTTRRQSLWYTAGHGDRFS